jgi:ABC-type transporter Mla subunit MlaD
MVGCTTVRARKHKRVQIKKMTQNAQAIDANYDHLYNAFKTSYNTTTNQVNHLVNLVRHQDETLLSTITNMDKLTEQVNDFLSFASPNELNYLLQLLAVLNSGLSTSCNSMMS